MNKNKTYIYFIGILIVGFMVIVSPRFSRTHAGTPPPATILLQTSLDSNTAITSPAVGIGGSSTLTEGDFVVAQTGNGAHFSDESKIITFPVADESTRNINLARGEVEFWYRPNYAADADDRTRNLIVVGDVYNPPNFVLREEDRLKLILTDAGFRTYGAEAAYRAPLWQANEWVLIRATWDANGVAPVQLYVNNVLVNDENSPSTGGWDLGTSLETMYVGTGNANGDFFADGVLDELVIRDAPPAIQPTELPPSQTIPPVATNAPAATNTPVPERPTTTGELHTDPTFLTTPIPMTMIPPYNQSYRDPTFGTTIRRITDRAPAGFGTHTYSQLQAFSPDGQYILLIEDGVYVVRRLSDLSLVELDFVGNAIRWQPSFPHTLVYYDDNADTTLRVFFLDVETGTAIPQFTFPPAYERIRTNQSFEALSHSGSRMAGLATRSDGDSVIFMLDFAEETLGAQLALSELYAGPCEPDPEFGEVEPDWVGISPLGMYLVVQWTRDGTTRCSGLESFDPWTGEFVGRAYDGHQHGDLGVGADGREYFITWEISAPPPYNSNNPGIGKRYLPGPQTGTPPFEFLLEVRWGQAGAHISCQGPNGQCLVTTDKSLTEVSQSQALDSEIFLLDTSGYGQIQRLAHHRSSSCGYWVQPRASISGDGRYAVFASDWGQATTEGDGCAEVEIGRGDAYLMTLAEAPEPTNTPTPFPTATPTLSPTVTPISTQTATATNTPMIPPASTGTPTATPSVDLVNTPTPIPSQGADFSVYLPITVR